MPRWMDADAPNKGLDDLLTPADQEDDFTAALAAHASAAQAPTNMHSGSRTFTRDPSPYSSRRGASRSYGPKRSKPSSKISSALMDPEAWDDSALVSAWEEAEQEYREHHGMDRMVKEKIKEEKEKKEEKKEEKEEEEEEEDKDEIPCNSLSDEPECPSDNTPTPVATSNNRPAPMVPPIDPSQLGDESLSNMLMAWYYAGYYTAQYQASQRE
ncbi:hypothetical protein BJ684DRAFT_19185 [Piptocephalis cylindrospora]|uniref:Survival Motor Neuron Gemin2-binding domain-containing protein n=1 Tax=Piptocephalis cylindrospora TaxID=1907219 RepID=A0A4P9Y5X9_9FUNG|nr:hypothetical protein BJ684DRAFT_19185 [Piptocephalis cylindrospora]|eukprot:RKP14407.1 hypothetical protein BJ684DRAFT_19185 [Piptocephalis cylindrospora]